jgi:hypothetical protein
MAKASGRGYIEDAATAVAAAEQGNPGIYLIANDRPTGARWLLRLLNG